MIRFAASFQPNLRNIWNIGKLDQNWHVIYNGLAKHGRSQNIMYPSQERKIWCIMVSWFYLIMTFLVARFIMIGYLNGLAKDDWSWAKIPNLRNKGFVRNVVLILPNCVSNCIGRFKLAQFLYELEKQGWSQNFMYLIEFFFA